MANLGVFPPTFQQTLVPRQPNLFFWLPCWQSDPVPVVLGKQIRKSVLQPAGRVADRKHEIAEAWQPPILGQAGGQCLRLYYAGLQIAAWRVLVGAWLGFLR